MFESLTGKPPFPGDNPIQVMMKHMHENRQILSTALRRLEVSASLEKVIRHCLEKNPEMRYQLVDELYKDLISIESGHEPLIAAKQSSGTMPIWLLSKNSHLAIGLVTALMGSWLLVRLSEYDTFSQIGFMVLGFLVLVYVYCFLYASIVLAKLVESLLSQVGPTTQLSNIFFRIMLHAAMPGGCMMVAISMFLDFARYTGFITFNSESFWRRLFGGNHVEVVVMAFIACLIIGIMIMAAIRRDELEAEYRKWTEHDKIDDQPTDAAHSQLDREC
jgi:hypothetical protein